MLPGRLVFPFSEKNQRQAINGIGIGGRREQLELWKLTIIILLGLEGDTCDHPRPSSTLRTLFSRFKVQKCTPLIPPSLVNRLHMSIASVTPYSFTFWSSVYHGLGNEFAGLYVSAKGTVTYVNWIEGPMHGFRYTCAAKFCHS